MEELTSKDEIFNLWLLMSKVNRAIFKAREKELKLLGITPEQCEILFAVSHLGIEAHPTKIAKAMLREPHTISTIINRMIEKGLLKRVNRSEKKKLLVGLTKKGEKAQCQTLKRDSIHTIISVLNEEDRKQLWIYLESMLNSGITILDTYYKSPWSSI